MHALRKEAVDVLSDQDQRCGHIINGRPIRIRIVPQVVKVDRESCEPLSMLSCHRSCLLLDQELRHVAHAAIQDLVVLAQLGDGILQEISIREP